MKYFISFDLTFEDGLIYTKIMDADTDGANEIGTDISEDWESSTVTFHQAKASPYSEVVVFKRLENLDSDFWNGEIRIYHLRGVGIYERFLRLCADENVEILGVANCTDKNLSITTTPVLNMDLGQLFPHNINITNAIDDINLFGADIRKHKFQHDKGGILEKLSYLAGMSVAAILNDGKIASSFEKEIVQLVNKKNPQSSFELYLIIVQMLMPAFKDNISAEQICELLLIREEIYLIGKERGVEPGFFDCMYEDLSQIEQDKIALNYKNERIEYNNSEHGHYLKSLRSSLDKLDAKKREIDLYLATKIIG